MTTGAARPPTSTNGPGPVAENRDFLGDPAALNVPPVESPFLESLLSVADVDEELAQQARFYHEHGYLVLEDAFEPELLDEIVDRYEWLFDPETSFEQADPDIRELLTLDPGRRQDAWWVCDAVGRLACHPRILQLLRLFYGREPIPFQTLNFLYGTEQPAHSDSIHFSSIPARYMCGVWVALEDIGEDNGPLLYYPGSHKLPEVQLDRFGVWGHPGTTAIGPTYTLYENYLRQLIQGTGLTEKRLVVRKGTALVWSANLLHGGSAIQRPGSTRKSQVTHYYFENCVYYAPIHSNTALGEYRLKDIHDLRTREPVPHSINGQPVVALPVSNGNHRLARPAEDRPAPHAADEDPGRRTERLAVEHEELMRQVRVLEKEREHRRRGPTARALTSVRRLLGLGRRNGTP